MKHQIIRILLALTLFFIWLGFHSMPALAASCYNVTCEGRYGCANYCYDQSISSPGTIANNSTVYTMMLAYVATPTRSCGIVSTSGPINIPISISSTNCTGAN